MTEHYRHVVYPTARALVLIDGEPVELTPADPRWREHRLDHLSRRCQEHLEASIQPVQETKR
jgi:hypothetical protein